MIDKKLPPPGWYDGHADGISGGPRYRRPTIEVHTLDQAHTVYDRESRPAVIAFAESLQRLDSIALVDAWLETGAAPQDIHTLVDFVLEAVLEAAKKEFKT